MCFNSFKSFCLSLLSLIMVIQFIILQFPFKTTPYATPSIQTYTAMSVVITTFIVNICHSRHIELLQELQPNQQERGGHLFWLVGVSTGGFLSIWSALYQFTIFWDQSVSVIGQEWNYGCIGLTIFAIIQFTVYSVPVIDDISKQQYKKVEMGKL
jgi:hypothetical protein